VLPNKTFLFKETFYQFPNLGTYGRG